MTQYPQPVRLKKIALPTQREPRCTVGLLTWNAGDEAFSLIRSLLSQSEEPFDMIWIDNASIDSTPERLKQAFPELSEPFINEENLGFCLGHNQAIRTCKTPYYLALNQDIILAPDYIEKLCDWLDEKETLAMSSGLILRVARQDSQADGADRPAEIASAGLVFPRVRFPFDLGRGQVPSELFRQRRLIPGVNGCAMMLRLASCRKVSIPRHEIFAVPFFAYHEEVDLALRLARAGFSCGVEGSTQAIHSEFSSEGIHQVDIMARYFSNHWLLTLRHDAWGSILRESPWILRGEIQYWLPRYLKHPSAFLRAVGRVFREYSRARRFYHELERKLGKDTRTRLASMRNHARKCLRGSEAPGQP
jgi:GT2 family glycosyltransferase